MKKFITSHFWLILFHALFLLSAIANFPIGKYFIGWDAISPEFNIPFNISQALFPFWQGNYGLGALTGHGFAATLPHTLFIGLLANFLPEWSLRTIFTLLCHYLGGLGMYFLIRHVLTNIAIKPHAASRFIPAISSLGALFYLFNLGTVQVFYIQLEAFIAQFAALPWLFLSLFLALSSGKKKHFILFFVISFLASIQGFIPSLFVTYFFMLIISLFIYAALNRKRQSLTRAGAALLLTACANLYWLLPVMYFQFTNGSNFLSAYNNLSSTQHFIELSMKYGTLQNVMYLKSYLFDSYQLGSFIMQPWISHYQNLAIPVIGALFFLCIVVGMIISIAKFRTYYTTLFAILFLLLFSGIAINTFPLSLLNQVLQDLSPTYEQAFRTTFTKFGIGAIFLYSIGFGLGILLITKVISKIKARLISWTFISIVLASILYYALPVFQGKLIYDKLTLQMPQAYTDFTSYINTQPEGRIADFPQNCSDGWYSYNWGYFGSGFMWYGVKHPFLSRSFDVWSPDNENYYWELSQALNQKDYEKARIVLSKYHVKWILYDPNVTSCSTNKKAAINANFIAHLLENGYYSEERRFGTDIENPLLLLANKSYSLESGIKAQSNIPHVAPEINRLDQDSQPSDYFTSSTSLPDKYYPIPSLLTKRGDNSLISSAKITDTEIVLQQTIPQGLAGYSYIDNFAKEEKLIPISLNISNDQNSVSRIRLTTSRPSITLDGKLLTKNDNTILLGVQNQPLPPTIKVLINGQEINQNQNNYQSYFMLNANNTVEILNDNQLIFSWSSEESESYNVLLLPQPPVTLPNYTNGLLEMRIPIVIDNKYFGARNNNLSALTPEPCNEIVPSNKNAYEIDASPAKPFIRLISEQSSQCLKLHFPQLIASQSYLLSIHTKNISGNLPKTSLYNSANLAYSDLGTGKQLKELTTSYIIPPSAQSDVGYDIAIENASKTSIKSVNDIYSVALYPIPYNFLKSVTFVRPGFVQNPSIHREVSAKQTNPTRYEVSFNETQLITLSQSYDRGWKAYIQNSNSTSGIKNRIHNSFPFIFSTEIKDHVLVNNWANGWIVPQDIDSKTITIVYLPQYLQYLGFGLLALPLLWLIIGTREFIFLALAKLNTYFEKQTSKLKSFVHLRMSIPNP